MLPGVAPEDEDLYQTLPYDPRAGQGLTQQELEDREPYRPPPGGLPPGQELMTPMRAGAPMPQQGPPQSSMPGLIVGSHPDDVPPGPAHQQYPGIGQAATPQDPAIMDQDERMNDRTGGRFAQPGLMPAGAQQEDQPYKGPQGPGWGAYVGRALTDMANILEGKGARGSGDLAALEQRAQTLRARMKNAKTADEKAQARYALEQNEKQRRWEITNKRAEEKHTRGTAAAQNFETYKNLSPADRALWDRKAKQASGGVDVRIGGNEANAAAQSDKKLRERWGTKTGDEFVAEAQAGRAAEGRMNRLDAIAGALANPNIYTGPLGETINTAKAFGQALGFDMNSVGEAEMIQSVRQDLWLDSVKKMKGMGSLSNAEGQRLDKGLPGLMNTPEGNRLIIGISRLSAEHDKARADVINHHMDNGLPVPQMRKALNEVDRRFRPQFRNFIKETRKQVKAKSRSPLAGLPNVLKGSAGKDKPDGTRYEDDDKVMWVKRNGRWERN